VIVSVSVRGRGERRRRGGFAGRNGVLGAVSVAMTVSVIGMSSGLMAVAGGAAFCRIGGKQPNREGSKAAGRFLRLSVSRAKAVP
jgi:hypothetical protein